MLRRPLAAVFDQLALVVYTRVDRLEALIMSRLTAAISLLSYLYYCLHGSQCAEDFDDYRVDDDRGCSSSGSSKNSFGTLASLFPFEIRNSNSQIYWSVRFGQAWAVEPFRPCSSFSDHLSFGSGSAFDAVPNRSRTHIQTDQDARSLLSFLTLDRFRLLFFFFAFFAS